MRPVPFELYPFDDHFGDVGGLRMHYLDEGEGDPVVMVHGNPTWSFYYRRLVTALSDRYRCIVPDHIGMGMSDKPGDDRYGFTLRERIEDFDALIEQLDLGSNITLVVHDWGGMIGMAWAAHNPGRIARLVILNTAAFPLPTARSFHLPLRFTRTRLGGVLVRRFNAFSEIAARTCVTRAPMSKDVREAYTAPYDSYEDRIATLRFVQDIPLTDKDEGYSILADTAARLDRFRDTPTIIFWGEKDFVFDRHFLAEWETRLPHAQVVRFPDCGHYVLEDAGDEIISHLERFLAR